MGYRVNKGVPEGRVNEQSESEPRQNDSKSHSEMSCKRLFVSFLDIKMDKQK